MDIAFVSGNAHLPQLMGGVEVNTHALAGELIRRGHRVSVLAKLSMRNSFGLSRVARNAVSGRKIWVDRDLGYPVFRSRRPWEDVADLPRPTVAVVQNGPMVDFATAFARHRRTSPRLVRPRCAGLAPALPPRALRHASFRPHGHLHQPGCRQGCGLGSRNRGAVPGNTLLLCARLALGAEGIGQSEAEHSPSRKRGAA